MLVDAVQDNQGKTEQKKEGVKSFEVWVRDREKAELCEAEARRARLCRPAKPEKCSSEIWRRCWEKTTQKWPRTRCGRYPRETK